MGEQPSGASWKIVLMMIKGGCRQLFKELFLPLPGYDPVSS
jgi:hypothetical protein